MPTERDDVNEEASVRGVHGHAHGDVEHWLHDNLPDEQLENDDQSAGSSTARSDERTTLTDTGQLQRNLETHGLDQAGAAHGSGDPADDNLIQLPIGAKFGLEHEPTPQEREDLVRWAAVANRELHGEDE